MKVDWKYFNFRSVSFQYKQKYSLEEDKESIVKFNNYFSDFSIAIQVIDRLRSCVENLRKIDYKSFWNNANNKKGWEIIDSNFNIEKILIVLQAYGYNRDYVISKIFDGYPAQSLGSDDETKESLISKTNMLLKISISANSKNEERIFLLVKNNKTIFPLFIDAHHHLMGMWIEREFKCDISSVVNHILFSGQ